MKNLMFVILAAILATFLFAGCLPAVAPDDPEPEGTEEQGLPVGIIRNIVIEPEDPIVLVGNSITLTVHAYNYPEMEEVYIDGDRITWSENCGEDVLDPDVGLSTVYVASDTHDTIQIKACYEWPLIEGCPTDPQYLCTGTTISIITQP